MRFNSEDHDCHLSLECAIAITIVEALDESSFTKLSFISMKRALYSRMHMQAFDRNSYCQFLPFQKVANEIGTTLSLYCHVSSYTES